MNQLQYMAGMMDLGFALGRGDQAGVKAAQKKLAGTPSNDTCTCGQVIGDIPVKYLIGLQRDEDGQPFAYLLNCPTCHSTRAYPYGAKK